MENTLIVLVSVGEWHQDNKLLQAGGSLYFQHEHNHLHKWKQTNKLKLQLKRI